jgi:hypothetical protein
MHAGDPPGVVEYEHVGSDGERLVVDWTSTIVHDAEGTHTLRPRCDGAQAGRGGDPRSRARGSPPAMPSGATERNLHDGAQQNLVTVTHSIHLAARSLRPTSTAEEHLERRSPS